MTSETTRLSVEIPVKTHRKLKILAEANGLTLREFILAIVDPVINPPKKLNQTTFRAMEDAGKGVDLNSFKDLDHLWQDLGLD